MVAHAITHLVAIACARRDHVPELIAMFGASPLPRRGREHRAPPGAHARPPRSRRRGARPHRRRVRHRSGVSRPQRVDRRPTRRRRRSPRRGEPRMGRRRAGVRRSRRGRRHDVGPRRRAPVCRAALRSAGPRPRPSECIALGDVDIDVAARAVRAAGTPVGLPRGSSTCWWRSPAIRTSCCPTGSCSRPCGGCHPMPDRIACGWRRACCAVCSGGHRAGHGSRRSPGSGTG